MTEATEKDREKLYKVFSFLRLVMPFDDFVLRMVRDIVYRRGVINGLVALENSLLAAERYDKALLVKSYKEEIVKMFPLEQRVRPKVDSSVRIQSYELPCTLHLPRARKRDLTSYDNRRDGYIVDRYYFGIYNTD